MSSEKDHAKFAGDSPSMCTIGKAEEVEDQMNRQTLPVCAEIIIPRYTVSEFDDLNEIMENELTEGEEPQDYPVFSATLKQIAKGEEGGYLIQFDVPERDRHVVSQILKEGARVFKLVVIPENDSTP